MPRKWVPERRHIVGSRPELPPGVVKSAGRVLQIFEFFDEVRREANVVEICATLGYPQSSTSALLRHTSVETSIMPFVISGTTEPGSASFFIRRSMSSA